MSNKTFSRRKALGILAIGAPTYCASVTRPPAAIEQPRISAGRSFCGISLREAGRKLLNEVESKTGKTTVAECKPLDWKKGHSDFLSDGTPHICLDPGKVTEEVIVHELSHLRLEINGYPVFCWELTQVISQDPAWPNLQAMFVEIQDHLSHHVFFSHLRQLGYSPDTPWRGQLAKLDSKRIQDGEFHHVAEWAFRTRMEVTDQHFIDRFEKSLQAQGKTNAATLGKAMASAVGDLTHWTSPFGKMA